MDRRSWKVLVCFLLIMILGAFCLRSSIINSAGKQASAPLANDDRGHQERDVVLVGFPPVFRDPVGR